MNQIMTPDMVIQELNRLVAEAAKAPGAIYDAECKLADCEFEFERVFQTEFLKSEGTVADRTALAKLASADARLAADLARAELSRMKNKAKQLSDAGVLNATIGRQIELMYKHGG